MKESENIHGTGMKFFFVRLFYIKLSLEIICRNKILKKNLSRTKLYSYYAQESPRVFTADIFRLFLMYQYLYAYRWNGFLKRDISIFNRITSHFHLSNNFYISCTCVSNKSAKTYQKCVIFARIITVILHNICNYIPNLKIFIFN